MSVATNTERPWRSSSWFGFRWHAITRGVLPWVFLAPALVAIVLFAYYPLVRTIGLSLDRWNLLSPPHYVGLANYRYLAQTHDFRNSLEVTAVFTAGNLVGTYLLSLWAALLLRRGFRGVRLVRTATLIPTVIPMVVAGLAWLWMLQPATGLIDKILGSVGLPEPNWLFTPHLALFSVIFVSIWRDFGIYTIVLLGGLLQIPAEISEAADLDSASGWRRLVHVTLPMIKGANIFVITLLLFNSLKAYDQIWVMTEGGPGSATTTVLTYVFRQISATDLGAAAAASIVLFVLVTVPFAIRMAFRRQSRDPHVL